MAAIVCCPRHQRHRYVSRHGGLLPLASTNHASLYSLGMGIKAVSATILASECAVGFWRGSTILAWQLWSVPMSPSPFLVMSNVFNSKLHRVAFGIMIGFAFNFLFTTAQRPWFIFRLIQGAPLVPALVLFITAMFLCPESPRYHLMKGPGYSILKAYKVLQRLRNTEVSRTQDGLAGNCLLTSMLHRMQLQALRDLYVVVKDLERDGLLVISANGPERGSPGFLPAMQDFCRQFVHLFTRRRLQNALISTSTVNLAQQLCGGKTCCMRINTSRREVPAHTHSQRACILLW